MAAHVELFHDLNDVAADAAGALEREKRPLLFERLDWLRLVQEHTPPPGKFLGIRARNGEACAWLFVALQRGTARPFSNWYCLRYGPVIDGTPSAAVLDGLARGLRRASISHLVLAPLDGDDPLEAALRRQGWITRRTEASVRWRVRTAGMTFDEYWAGRPSRLRNTVKRRARSAGLELAVHHRFDAAAWHDYESVYAHSWKPDEGSPALLRELAEAEGAARTLRLGLAYRNGVPVAAQLWTIEHKVATIHKLAYREDAKQYSPGTILSVELFRRAIDEDKVEIIDFGIGNDAYKAEWMDEAQPLHALTAFDARSVNGLFAVAGALSEKLVRRLRSR